jgi:hypothetical protein
VIAATAADLIFDTLTTERRIPSRLTGLAAESHRRLT